MDAISTPLPTQIAPLTLPKVDGRKGRKKTEAELQALARGREISVARRKEQARLRKLDRDSLEEELKARIADSAPELLRWAMLPAKGCTYIYRIDKTEGERGKTIEKHVLVENAHEIATALDQLSNGQSGEDEYYYITTDKPDFRAVEMLLNRAFGRPAEHKNVDIRKRSYSLVEIAQRAEERAKPTIKP